MVKLGQNFLIDENIAKQEVQYADVNKEDVVLEVGAGKGLLTNFLAEKAGEVIAVEIDSSLVDYLQSFLPDNVELVNKDILKLDFKRLPDFNKVVSNLPFQISSPFTFKILDHDFEIAVLIYQKDFAERLVANPGSKEYSRLTVGVYYKSCCKLLRIVPRNCFSPQPDVDAALVKIRPRQKPPFFVENEEFFFRLTRDLFNHRRKKIKTTLKNLYGNIGWDEVSYVEKRVEKLTPEEIGEISNQVYHILKEKK